MAFEVIPRSMNLRDPSCNSRHISAFWKPLGRVPLIGWFITLGYGWWIQKMTDLPSCKEWKDQTKQLRRTKKWHADWNALIRTDLCWLVGRLMKKRKNVLEQRTYSKKKGLCIELNVPALKSVNLIDNRLHEPWVWTEIIKYNSFLRSSHALVRKEWVSRKPFSSGG